MLDGHTMMEFFEPVARGVIDYSGSDEGAAMSTDNEIKETTIRPMKWEIDLEIKDAIKAAMDVSIKKSASCGVETLEYVDFGKRFITSHKFSPDGFVQAAMILSFYLMRDRMPVAYESVLAKAFKHGRVTVARNMSVEIAAQLSNFFYLPDSETGAKVAAFTAIVADVGRICRAAASAQDMDRPLLALRNVAAKHGLPYPSITEDASWAKLDDLDLCTSHCGKGPGIRFFGYEPAAADCFSIGYYVDKDRIQFSINHFDKAEAAAYKKALRGVLRGLKRIITDAEKD
jgi:carnitine O-acetyltransferase